MVYPTTDLVFKKGQITKYTVVPFGLRDSKTTVQPNFIRLWGKQEAGILAVSAALNSQTLTH